MAGDFSDEEWDISDDQLQVLEQNAILSTQQRVSRNAKQPVTSRSASLNPSHTQRLDTPVLQRVAAAVRPVQNAREQVSEDSFESPSLDEDGIPLVVEEQTSYMPVRRPDETTQREQWRANRFAQGYVQPQPPARTIPHQAYPNYQQSSQYGRPIQQNLSTHHHQPPAKSSGQDAVQARLEELLKERDLLTQNLNNVTAQLHTARGENAVVRNKGGNDLKAAERQINILKKQMQEEGTKHQAILQAKDASYSKLVTDSNFLKHELDEQIRKVKTLQQQAKDKPLHDRTNQANLSPRKGAAISLRDGFDDDEIMLMSPSRSPAKGRRSKPGTPTNRKRKQPAMTEPDVPPLVLRLSGGNERDEDTNKPTTKAGTKVEVVKDHETERHLQFIQDVLSFRPFSGQVTVVEGLVQFAFPSEPTRPLSSIVLAETSKLKGKRLPGDLLDCFTRLLDRCAKEDYYKPLALLLATFDHILDIDPTVIDADIIRSLLPPVQSLIEVNARRRWILADITKIWDPKFPRPPPDPEINTSACLDLLVVIASLVLDEKDLLEVFWRCLPAEFILMILAPHNPIADITLVLELLATSIVETTFGSICTGNEQATMESYIIDKVCYLLWEPPRHVVLTRHDKKQLAASKTKKSNGSRKLKGLDPDPVTSPTRIEICNLRLAALSLLSRFIVTSIPHPHGDNIATHHGTTLATTHPKLIARLTRSIYDELTSLYAHHPDTHTLHATLVDRAIVILHHILTSPQAKNLDLPKALLGTSVGVHKFRVAMCRLAFREGLKGGIDEGISEETVNMATEILEEYVTPDEAVQLLEAFGRSSLDDDEDDDEQETLADGGTDAEAEIARIESGEK
ncbi:hypothetical protein H2198_002890 [Neophaeococcomyces mojaviensis]|uniref:Uncharacterized protein n=1 Tax=Neophaeococcomyces mojaviensis TaxID=3383035 RepID=A0ACC3ADA3_9EURO|nr:hypothetical protein H2198_002890 [Knufia sp. JES_112]